MPMGYVGPLTIATTSRPGHNSAQQQQRFEGPLPADVAQWLFICARDGTWTWRSANSAASSPLPNLDAAVIDATAKGFDPFIHYWTTTTRGRTTHFRPGQTPVNLPSDEDPPA